MREQKNSRRDRKIFEMGGGAERKGWRGARKQFSERKNGEEI